MACTRGPRLLLSLAMLVLARGDSGHTTADSNLPEGDRPLGERVRVLESLLTQQAERLSHQETLNQLQAQQLSAEHALLREQRDRLSHQDKVIRQLQQTVGRLEANQERKPEAQSQQTYIIADSIDKNNEMSKKDFPGASGRVGHSEASNHVESSQSHSVLVRADDSSPLQVVVNQMGQQLTEMKADVQAFKTQTTTDMQSLRSASSQQDQDIQDARTSTYTHWGSSRCSSDSQLIYSGVVGGSYYSHSGAATNFLCLTLSPIMSNHAAPYYAAYLYGGEYETEDSHEQMDPVCAVCRSHHPTTIMIPGTTQCTQGWHRQYSGYLMSNYYNSGAGSEYICVDSAFEGRPGSGRNDNGKLLYFTVAQCGALPCTPYVEDKVVTCVVCSL